MASKLTREQAEARIKARKVAPKRKRAKRPHRRDGKRDGYEGILLRVRPEVKELLEATVEGMNDQRKPGDPPYSVTGVILMAITNTFGAPTTLQLGLRAHRGAA